METQEPKIPAPLANGQLSVWQFAGLLVIMLLIGLGAGYFIWGSQLKALETKSIESTATAAAQVTMEPNMPLVTRYDVTVDDDAVFGSDTAPITIIEFSDYQCPYCQKWHAEVYPQIKAKYGDKIRFVYRDFPLYNIHPEAGPAAEAAQCAGEQNKYYEFHDLLFGGGQQLGRETYDAYAAQLGLNSNDFQKCVDEGRYKEEVEADLQFASELGIESTPTFFINGLALVGAQPFSVFEKIIDMELAGQIPQ